MILSLKDIFVEHSDRVILDHIDINIQDNDKIGLIGINGTGKSTLLKAIYHYADLEEKHYMAKKNLKISYLDQDSNVFEQQDLVKYTSSNSSDLAIIASAKKILNQLGLNDHSIQADDLSGGQKKRLALAKTLVTPCDLLVLDEPTNHLDTSMIAWLEDYLVKINKAMIMITHDRYFLDNIVNKIVELSNGQLYEYDGNYQSFLEAKAQRLVDEQSKNRKQLALLKQEHAWVMQGPKARSTKSRDRIERYENLKENINTETKEDLVLDSMQSRLGKKILEISDLSVGYADKTLINDFTYTFKGNDRIGIVGANGSGKTTLLNTISGLVKPLKGTLDFGSTVQIGYFSQHSDDLNNAQRAIDYVKDKAEFIQTNDGLISASSMLEKFLFTSEKQYTLIEKLSGGEKRRLLLLGVLMQAPNFLILDEPTNDLDVETLTIFEDYLQNFKGVILVVSHDRYFMDKIVNSLWIVANEKITITNEDYSIYLNSLEQKQVNDKKVKTNNTKEYQKPKKLRFSYQEQKEFASIDSEIAKLEQKINDLSLTMNDYLNDYEKLAELESQLNVANEELEMKTMRWLELNEKNEQINNQ